jgi:hypothetical protein
MSLFICLYCSRVTTNIGAKAKHEKHCHSNPNYVKAYRSPRAGQQKGSIPWNKGIKSNIPAWNKGLKGTSKGIASTPEKEIARRIKISETAKTTNGGYRKGSGRGKKGYYKGIWCDSSWELAFVIYNIDHNISFERNKISFPYEYNGKLKKYIPDFIIENTFIEIKGYYTEQVKSKVEQFKHKLIIINSDKIKPYIEYAVNKYGKDFIKLYDIGE